MFVLVFVPLHYSTPSQAVLDTVAGQPSEMKVSRTGRLGLARGRERERHNNCYIIVKAGSHAALSIYFKLAMAL